MKNPFSLVLLALLSTAAVAQDPPKPAPAPAPAPKVLKLGSEVPASLALPDIDGTVHRFGDLRGKVVFVHFWSITCPWERVADPKIAKIEKDYAGKDVVVLAINANQDEIGPKPAPADFQNKDMPYRRIREAMERTGNRHTVLADHGNVVADLFEARSTPHCFVLDRKGIVRYAGGLDDDGRSEQPETPYVRNAIDALLAGEKVEVTTSQPYGCTIKRARRRGRSRSGRGS